MTPEEHDRVTHLMNEVRRLRERVRYLTELATREAQARQAAEAKAKRLSMPRSLADEEDL